jgi:hypothetical protein
MHFTISRVLLIIVSFFSITASYSQAFKGWITDKKNKPVPFAAIYDETTFAGTTSNAEGYYELRLDSGRHSIVFRALGFYQERRQVAMSGQHVSLNIQLSEQVY